MKNTFGKLVVCAAACAIGGLFAQERVQGLERENVVWRNVGPGGGGWIQSMTASRYDPQRFLVGCDVGGFYYSENGGRSYETRNKGLKHMFIETIAEHPTKEDVIFLGSLGGIYKTTNRGRVWEEKRQGLPPIGEYHHTIQIAKFAFDPVDPDVMYAAVGAPRSQKGKIGGVLKSTNGGESWGFCAAPNQLPDKVAVFDISISSKDRNRILITTFTNGVYLSTDGGVHWTPSSQGLPGHLRARRLAQSSSNPNVVYVTMRHKGGEKPWNAGVYRSDDGGVTWSARNKGLPAASGQKGFGDALSHWYDCILVHPANPDIVYAGSPTWWGAGVYKSIDGGKDWKRVFDHRQRTGWIQNWGPSVYSFTISPANPEILAFGTSGHVFRTEDGGVTWSQRYTEDRNDGKVGSIGLEVTCLHEVQADPTRRGRFFLSYFDIGLFITEDNGRTLEQRMNGVPSKYANSCYGIQMDPQNPKHWWGTFGNWGPNNGCLGETFDEGRNWTMLTNAASGFVDATASHLVLIGDKPPYTLAYIARGHGIRVSHDSGKTWQGIDTSAAPGLKRAHALCVDNGVLYAGTTGGDNYNAEIWKSADRGQTWTNVMGEKENVGEVMSLDVKGDKIFVAARGRWSRPRGMRHGGGFYSTDGGQTWSRVFKDRFAGSAKIAGDNLFLSLKDNPYHDHCEGGGIVRSRDGGKTWTTLNSDSLHNVNVSNLCIDPFDPNVIWAGTGGNSIFVGRFE